jgi:hypothetical protein
MNNIDVFKKDKNVQKFMKKYRYQYAATMLPDLAELVRSAYVEGYNNGLGQHPVPTEATKEPIRGIKDD